MKNNKLSWVLVAIVVLMTLAITFGVDNKGGHEIYAKSVEPTPAVTNPFGDVSKYPSVDYDSVETGTAAEIEERKIKNKRYDENLEVTKNPYPDDTASITFDGEQLPSALPNSESKLIILGEVLSVKALLSNGKKGVYTEYSIRVERVLKNTSSNKVKAGQTIVVDRAGGVVRYPNGQKILYMHIWHGFLEVGGRYTIFLTTDYDENQNYKILTGYQFKNGSVVALDKSAIFQEHSGKSEKTFLDLIADKQ